MVKNEYFTLNNGVKIPAVGFGTWQAADGEEAYKACRAALEAGYRHIDTAFAYGNEQSVARAVADSEIDREDIFITTKLPSHIKNYDDAVKYFSESANNLKTDYIDLYLIHAPWPWSNVGQDCTAGNIDVWRAMTELCNAGRIRAVGVSNFAVRDIEALIDATGYVPAVNQIRYFVGNTQDEITSYCKSCGILVEAYSPLATGEIVENASLKQIAEKYGVGTAQLCIRFCLENGTLPLPKSVKRERIFENIDLDFKISQEDMSYLNGLYHIGSVKPYRS